MKISSITPLVLGTPWREIVFLKVTTDEGLVGVGEARPLNRTDTLLAYLQEAAPRYVLGADPFEIERLTHRMYRDDFGRAGEVVMTGHRHGRDGLLGHHGQGARVSRSTGCWAARCATGSRPMPTAGITVERTPDEFHAAALQVVESGYRALKFDPFGAGFYELTGAEKRRVVELVEAVRDAVGPDVEILVEMHGRFNPVTAVEMARELAPFQPAWIEEPVPPENLSALREVRNAVLPLGIPVATGERIHTPYEYRELFELQAADVIQPDITHFGGLLKRKKMAATAESHYILIAPHNVGGPVSTAAALHLAACTDQLQDSGALQRLRRCLRQGGGSRRAGSGGWLFRAAGGSRPGRDARRGRDRGAPAPTDAFQPVRR